MLRVVMYKSMSMSIGSQAHESHNTTKLAGTVGVQVVEMYK